MNLYQYFEKNLHRSDPYPAIDHSVRCQMELDGNISFYIHAASRDSDTPIFVVDKNGNIKCDTKVNENIFNCPDCGATLKPTFVKT